MTEPLTPSRIAELRKLAEKATKGPWYVARGGLRKERADHDTVYACNDDLNYVAECKDFLCFHEPPRNSENAAFIAALDPQTVIALLDVVEAAQALVATEEGGEQDHAFRKLAEALATLSPEKQP